MSQRPELLKSVTGSDGVTRYYAYEFLKRLDEHHFRELVATTEYALATESTYDDDGTVLGNQTRGNCRKLQHPIFKPHGNMTQIVLVKHPKGLRAGCRGVIVGKAKTPVKCRDTKRRLKGQRRECDCPINQWVMRVIAKQTKGKEHRTMRLNQIVSPYLVENNVWLFVCTKIKRSRRGARFGTRMIGSDDAASEGSEGSMQELEWSTTPAPSSPPCPPSPSCCCSCSCTYSPTLPSSPPTSASPTFSNAPPSPSSTQYSAAPANSTPFPSPGSDRPVHPDTLYLGDSIKTEYPVHMGYVPTQPEGCGVKVEEEAKAQVIAHLNSEIVGADLGCDVTPWMDEEIDIETYEPTSYYP